MKEEKDFEEWYKINFIKKGLGVGLIQFYRLPFSMQQGVYLEYLDSVGYRIEITNLKKQLEEIKEHKETFVELYKTRKLQVKAMQKQLEESKKENKVLVNTINEVWNEENGSVQMHTPIAWYRVLRLININS